ncbi:MAG: CaiB/BaiF CoA-transferase family protein [Pseudomonadota bacterium]|nr:CaiB/BaiF CoA-transferase family protein [Pseudomonadota bacterium]
MNASLPLSGLRVLDLSRVLAGPLAAQVLGDLGAEVIKVEHPARGDDTRDWGVRTGETNSAYFNSMNRNKLSITLDLQQPEGQRLARELALQSDVLIQNFKFGGTARMGLGYDTLAAANPGLVYCSITGYDPTGPEAARPGYDLVVQGETGLMGLNGEEGQPPLKFGVAMVDLFTGMSAGQAVLAALWARERGGGKGRHVQLALHDCGVMLSVYYGMEALLQQADPPKYGNAHPSIVPYGVFDAADGPLVVTVGNNAQFQRLCQDVIDRPEWVNDERFATNTARAIHRHTFLPLLREELARRPRAELLDKLTRAGIPCGEVLGVLDALTSPRTQASGGIAQATLADGTPVPVQAPPYRLEGQRLPIRHAPPTLGQHTAEVLREHLGVDDAGLAALRASGVV